MIARAVPVGAKTERRGGMRETCAGVLLVKERRGSMPECARTEHLLSFVITSRLSIVGMRGSELSASGKNFSERRSHSNLREAVGGRTRWLRMADRGSTGYFSKISLSSKGRGTGICPNVEESSDIQGSDSARNCKLNNDGHFRRTDRTVSSGVSMQPMHKHPPMTSVCRVGTMMSGARNMLLIRKDRR